MLSFFPKYFSDRAIYLYVALLLVVSVAFGYSMKWYWFAFGLVEVIGFFWLSNKLTIEWARYSDKTFEKKVFSTALMLRLAYVVFSYFFYEGMTGHPFEFNSGDAMWYHDMGDLGARIWWGEDIKWSVFFEGVELSDLGYPTYLSVLYALLGRSILLVRCVKPLLSAWTVVLMYRIAYRNFGRGVARMTAIFCMLMPNLIYYCGMHLKETEMLLLTVLFIERADVMLRSKQVLPRDLLLLLFLGGAVFFFREVLCYVLFLALLTSMVLSSTRMVRWGRSAALVFLGLAFVGVIVFNIFNENVKLGSVGDVAEQQEQNMQWRSERDEGNNYAKYAGAAVFAPLIFTIPFPTMVDIPFQQDQQMIHGGNYVKNITSFFTILALLFLLLSKRWKEHVLPVAFLCGYLVVLVFSNYAQSERFHIPILPFSLMFAAYGVTQLTNLHKKWFDWWMAFIFAANVAWAWFKLRGRGM